MNPHVEIESTRSLAGALGERFWGWEIPLYLFLGGVVAGLMVAVSALLLWRGKDRATAAMRTGLWLAPVLLGTGMGALFLDLSYKLHVYRFYLAARPSSPKSWGSWILLLVVPVQLALVLALPPARLARQLDRMPDAVRRIRALALRHFRGLAAAGLAGGVALGVYTGILLSATVARPLWSSGALGPLFLASGASTGVATLMLFEKDEMAHGTLARFDIAAIAVEVALLGTWLIGLLGQGPLYREAAGVVLWGSYAPLFLGFVVFGGLLVPVLLEALALKGKAAHSRVVPALVLAGGFLLRVVVVYAGQVIGFVRA